MMEQKFKAIESFFNIQSLKTFQKDSLYALDKGNDVFLCVATGGGKSLVYQAYAMSPEAIVIIFTPLAAIMKEQVSQP